MEGEHRMGCDEEGSLDELYDRLVTLLKGLPPDRQEQFREKLNRDLQQGRREPAKRNLGLVESEEPRD